MFSVEICAVVAAVLAVYAHSKGRTGWHWFALSVGAFAAIWISTIVTLDLAGVGRIGVGSHKLAAFAGALTGIMILIILISVPKRVRRPVAPIPRQTQR